MVVKWGIVSDKKEDPSELADLFKVLKKNWKTWKNKADIPNKINRTLSIADSK